MEHFRHKNIQVVINIIFEHIFMNPWKRNYIWFVINVSKYRLIIEVVKFRLVSWYCSSKYDNERSNIWWVNVIGAMDTKIDYWYLLPQYLPVVIFPVDFMTTLSCTQASLEYLRLKCMKEMFKLKAFDIFHSHCKYVSFIRFVSVKKN